MRIAVPQYTFSKDHKRMLRRALDEIASAGTQGADLVCFPSWFVALNPVAETPSFEGQVMTALGTFFSGRGMEIVGEMLVFSGEGLSEADRERAFALDRKVAAYKQMEEGNVQD